MNNEILDALSQITREKSVDRAMLIETLETGLAIFPAGRLARRAADGSLSDPPWAATAVSLAQKYQAPVLPIHLEGPWSTLFHLFNQVSSELRDITLFHELLNKRGRAFSLTIGPLIAPAQLAGGPAEVVERLKAHVEHGLAADPDRVFA